MSRFSLIAMMGLLIPMVTECNQIMHSTNSEARLLIKEKIEKKRNVIVFEKRKDFNPITFSGNIIIGLGSIGLLYSGAFHISSKTAPFMKDRFVNQEIRNLLLKISIPITTAGILMAYLGKRIIKQ